MIMLIFFTHSILFQIQLSLLNKKEIFLTVKYKVHTFISVDDVSFPKKPKENFFVFLRVRKVSEKIKTILFEIRKNKEEKKVRNSKEKFLYLLSYFSII